MQAELPVRSGQQLQLLTQSWLCKGTAPVQSLHLCDARADHMPLKVKCCPQCHYAIRERMSPGLGLHQVAQT